MTAPPILPLTEPPTPLNEPPTPLVVPNTEPAALPAELLTSYNTLIAERGEENRQLRAQLAALQVARDAPPPKSKEDASREFFENPIELLRAEISRAIEPINTKFAEDRRRTDYADLKRKMKLDPRFADLDQIEAQFDDMMKNQELNENLMIAVYYSAYGMAAKAGKLNTAPDPNPPTPRSVVTPPHLRPTPPAAPAPINNANLRPLTENEETIRRFNRMTHEEYLRGTGEIK